MGFFFFLEVFIRLAIIIIFFWNFSFCLKDPNILLSGINYGPKFNFIGYKITKGDHKFFFEGYTNIKY